MLTGGPQRYDLMSAHENKNPGDDTQRNGADENKFERKPRSCLMLLVYKIGIKYLNTTRAKTVAELRL